MLKMTSGRIGWLAVAALLVTGPVIWGAGAGATFRGKVVDASGRPIAAAKVGLYEMTGGVDTPTGYVVNRLTETTTEADGTFSFAAAGSDAYSRAVIVARKSGLALGWAYWVMRENKQQDITLTPPQQLGGVVVDVEGKPLRDATVFVTSGQIGTRPGDQRYLLGPPARQLLAAKTDATGHFTLDNLAGDAMFDLGVEKPGYATMMTFDQSSSGQRLSFATGKTDVRLVMHREARIEGRVVDRDSGRPVSGVSVVARSEQGIPSLQPEPATSQVDGAFAFDALLSGAYSLSVAMPEEGLAEWVAAPVPVALEAGQTQNDVTIAVSKGGIVEFVITAQASGEPIDRARVSIRDAARNQGGSVVSNVEGIARKRLMPGTYQLSGPYKQGYTRGGGPPSVTVVENTTQRVAMTLAESPKVSGIVRDPEGKPVAGAEVLVLPRSTRDAAVSDVDGRYEVVWDRSSWGERDTTFCLLVRHAERNLAIAVEMGPDVRTLDVKLQPAVTVVGKVVNPDGQSIAGARITPMLRMSNWGSSIARNGLETGPDGSFAVPALPRGQRYNIRAFAEGHGSADSDVEADRMQGDRVTVEALTLPVANLSISGRVVDADGHPIAGVRLEGYGEAQPNQVGTQTDSEGRFVLDGVCAGQIDLRADVIQEGRRLSGRMVAKGGVTDVRIVVREGRPPVQYHSGKTYDQIVADSAKVIAGVAVDERGAPVADVPVGVCCHKRIREDGRMSWMYSSFSTLRATTDEQGRFAIALEEDGEYNLLFSPSRQAAVIVYDVKVNTKDLKVVLEDGGTLEGRLMRLEGGSKAPVANAEVKLEQESRTSYTHLGFDRDRTTLTDAQGRFRFEHVQTGIRPMSSRNDAEWTPVPRVWELSYGDTTETIAFAQGKRIEDFELLVKPNLDTAAPLTGSPLPPFEGMAIELPEDQAKSKAMLICFFDYQQRPSRNTVLQLARKAEDLKGKNIVAVVVQTSAVERAAMDTWARDNNVSFPVGTITGDVEATRAVWHVQGLPWLVLTDKTHVVRAEGFSLDDLDAKIADK
jgi:uncharacterized GH25 family protein